MSRCSGLDMAGTSRSSSSSSTITIWTDGRIPVPERPDHPIHEQTGTTDVLTFYPTMEEFRDFPAYIKKIEATGAHTKCGICKVVPPEQWKPRPRGDASYKDIDDFVIVNPVKEKTTGRSGLFTKSNAVFRRKMTVGEFRKLATSREYANPAPHLMGSEMEHHFFRNILLREPIYGADTEGSLYDDDVMEFNMHNLGTILDELTVNGKKIPGVNTVYLYFGMYKTMFPWHCEDMDLYSINYLHFGEPKYWFGIPSESAERFERLMNQSNPGYNSVCKAFLRHKSYLCTPTVLRAHNIPYGTMVQNANEFIITFPKGYHMGWNTGYNCAESTNFASDRWIDFGKNAILCKCRPDCVEIDMTPFMKKYRPDEFEAWYSYWYEPKPTAGIVKKPGRRKSGTPVVGSPPSKKKALADEMTEARETASLGPIATETLPLNPPFIGRKIALNDDSLSSNKIDLFAEKEFNRADSLCWPHCAVCNYFQPRHIQRKTKQIPKRSTRLVSGLCFSKDPSRSSIQEVAEDILLTCANCQVTVHSACYSGDKWKDAWKCLRCRGRTDVAVRATSCVLCEMRGGALIPCHAGSDTAAYAHVVCAIFNRRTSFNSINGPSICYIHPPPKQASATSVLSSLPGQYVIHMDDSHEKSRYECDVCGISREGLVRCVVCPDDASNPTLVHATCGRRVGYLFELRHYPQCAAMVCGRHTFEDPDEDVASLSPLSPSCEVVVWLDGGGRVLRGVIEGRALNEYLVIEFLDGTVSHNTPVSDVTSCSCETGCVGGKHQPGARLKVRWDDDIEYDGYFRRCLSVMDYSIRLADSSLVTVTRADLYGPEDALPVEVRKKLEQCMQRPLAAL